MVRSKGFIWLYAVCFGVIRGAVRDTTRFPNCFNSLPPLSLKMYFDIHTHHLSACPSEAIYNADSKYMPTPDEAIYISVGIHPWHLTDEDYPVRLQWVESMLQNDKRIIALGEAGLDKCCDTPSALQEEAFRKVISLSEHYCRPLIIHAVKAYNELIALKKEVHLDYPWLQREEGACAKFGESRVLFVFWRALSCRCVALYARRDFSFRDRREPRFHQILIRTCRGDTRN